MARTESHTAFAGTTAWRSAPIAGLAWRRAYRSSSCSACAPVGQLKASCDFGHTTAACCYAGLEHFWGLTPAQFSAAFWSQPLRRQARGLFSHGGVSPECGRLALAPNPDDFLRCG